MRIRDLEEDEGPAFNLTPMIDVVFLLLVFFMLATTFLDPERELDVELPTAESGAAPDAELDSIVINVHADGRLTLGGVPVDEGQLLDALEDAAERNPETSVTIRGDRLAHHERIVTVMDACGTAGLFNLSVGTREEG